MKRIICGVGILCLVVLFVSTAQAGTQAGQSEVSVSGSLRNQSVDYGGGSSDESSINGALTYNYYVSDVLSIGGTLQLQTRSPDEGDDSGSMFFLGRSDYYLVTLMPDSDWIPYAGARLGFASYEGGGESESAFAYGLQVGAKTFLKENISVNVELNTLTWSSGDYDITDTGIDAGVSYYF